MDNNQLPPFDQDNMSGLSPWQPATGPDDFWGNPLHVLPEHFLNTPSSSVPPVQVSSPVRTSSSATLRVSLPRVTHTLSRPVDSVIHLQYPQVFMSRFPLGLGVMLFTGLDGLPLLLTLCLFMDPLLIHMPPSQCGLIKGPIVGLL